MQRQKKRILDNNLHYIPAKFLKNVYFDSCSIKNYPYYFLCQTKEQDHCASKWRKSFWALDSPIYHLFTRKLIHGHPLLKDNPDCVNCYILCTAVKDNPVCVDCYILCRAIKDNHVWVECNILCIAVKRQSRLRGLIHVNTVHSFKIKIEEYCGSNR